MKEFRDESFNVIKPLASGLSRGFLFSATMLGMQGHLKNIF